MKDLDELTDDELKACAGTRGDFVFQFLREHSIFDVDRLEWLIEMGRIDARWRLIARRNKQP